MNYRIRIRSANADITLPTSEFEQLGEAIKRFCNYGFRDGAMHWNGVSIVECGTTRGGEFERAELSPEKPKEK